MLDAAWDSGIRYFDTAPHYGLGLSERRLGAFLQTKPRDEYVLSTKVGRLLRPNPDHDGGLDTANDFHVPDDLQRVWDFSADGIRAQPRRVARAAGHRAHRPALPARPRAARPRPRARRGAAGARAAARRRRGRRDRHRLDGVGCARRLRALGRPRPDHGRRPLHAARAAGRRRRAAGMPARPGRGSSRHPSSTPACSRRTSRAATAATSTASCRTSCGTGCCASPRCAPTHDVPLPAAAIQFPLQSDVVRSVVVGGSRPAQLRQNAEYAALEIPARCGRTSRPRG